MLPKLSVVHLAGPSCSGKSSIFRVLDGLLPENYTVAYDRLKWQMSHYHRDKHKALVKELTEGFFQIVCNKHIPILLDAFIENEDEYTRYKQYAEKEGKMIPLIKEKKSMLKALELYNRY